MTQTTPQQIHDLIPGNGNIGSTGDILHILKIYLRSFNLMNSEG